MGSSVGGVGALVALVVFIVASGWIGVLANRAVSSGSFMKGFFLGNRGLGAWAMALTATVQSGGTFMGFPSLVYTHGWIVALWIGSYMVVPITGFVILGKRLAQLSRRTGAITIPDLFRERFGSATLGTVASLCLLFYLSFMMVAQFKAGAIVMKLSWPGSQSMSLSEDFADFELTASGVDSVVANGLPRASADKLQPLLGKNFSSDKELRDSLKEQLGEEEYNKYQGALVKAATPIDWLYFLGLGIFALTVVGYTMAGGFLAAVWTDLFQSVMMFLGVVLLLCLCLGSVGSLQEATLVAVKNTSPDFAFGPGYDPEGKGRLFLPISLAFSFYVVWVYSGVSSPASMVRIMASDSTGTLRRSIYLLSIYNCFIYVPLICICICGRNLIPNLSKTDEIIPRLALLTTQNLPLGSFIGGLILAAPFGAIMATVSCYLVVIASGIVRDVYQRMINPHATEHELKRLSRWVMVAVGTIAVLANINPVSYLQALVVFSSTGAGTTFLIPALMACYWRRATVPGVLAAMFAGGGCTLLLYATGIFQLESMFGLPANALIGGSASFRPYYLLGLDPMIWGILASAAAGISTSLATTPPDAALLSRMFDRLPPKEVEVAGVRPALAEPAEVEPAAE